MYDSVFVVNIGYSQLAVSLISVATSGEYIDIHLHSIYDEYEVSESLSTGIFLVFLYKTPFIYVKIVGFNVVPPTIAGYQQSETNQAYDMLYHY